MQDDVEEVGDDGEHDPLNILIAQEEAKEETVESILQHYFETQPTIH